MSTKDNSIIKQTYVSVDLDKSLKKLACATHLTEAEIIRQALEKYRDQDISFVDALSLTYLELDNSVKDVFTFDHHFHISGKNILPYK